MKVQTFRIIILSVLCFIFFIQIAVAEQISVSGSASEGVTWTAPDTGIYRVTIIEGAVKRGYCIIPEICDSCSGPICYTSLLYIYINHGIQRVFLNRSVQSGPENYCSLLTISPDFTLGTEPFNTLSEAEAATKGTSKDMYLNKGDSVVFTIRDCEPGYKYNSGSITVDISGPVMRNSIFTASNPQTNQPVAETKPWTFSFIERGRQEKSLDKGTMVQKWVKIDYFLTESGFFTSKCHMQTIISEDTVVSDDVMPERFCDYYYISGQGQLPMNEQLNLEQNFLQVQKDITRERSMQDMLKRGNDASQQALRNSQLQKNMYNLNKF